MSKYFLIGKIKFWYDIESDVPNKNENITTKAPCGKYVRLHREDGPSNLYPDGSEFWYIKGKYHREDGPSAIYLGKCFWYLNGIKYSFNEWCEKLNKSPEEINFLKLRWNII